MSDVQLVFLVAQYFELPVQQVWDMPFRLFWMYAQAAFEQLSEDGL